MTKKGLWQWTEKDARRLQETIQQLVRIPSVTDTPAENDIADAIAARLKQLSSNDTSSIVIEEFTTNDKRKKGIAALYKRSHHRNTVVLIAHTDVVSVQDYGPHAEEAFDIHGFTNRVHAGLVDVPDEAKLDFTRGEWWFGRGVMDMKAGLALNLVLFEKACTTEDDTNLLFLAVPDEESHSKGMLAATELLLRWREVYQLDYALCLNSEPSFVSSDATSGSHIYSGTFGKLLLGALAVGMPGHVGIPFSGVNAIQMVTHLAQRLEANASLSERTQDGSLVPLTCLWLRDLATSYSVQSPHLAAAFFHVPFFQRSPSQVLSLVRHEAQEAMSAMRQWTQSLCQQAGVPLPSKFADIPVLWVSELFRETEPLVQQGIDADNALLGTLEAISQRIADRQVANEATLVLFLAPPVYPAVDAAGHPLVEACIEHAQEIASREFGVTLERQRSFTGLCDLSYTGYQLGSDWAAIASEMPAWGRGYELPLQTMSKLGIPVCNLGPFGKDAHQWTERLDVDYATRILPVLSHAVIQKALAASTD